MMPARKPRPAERLLWIHEDGFGDRRAVDLPSLLQPGDLLVVNDAATLPGSLQAGEVEIRLVAERPDGTFRAVVFGAGDWRTPTEHRPPPRALAVGDSLEIGRLQARVERVVRPRLVDLRFDAGDAALWMELYRVGRPVQYSHLQAPLQLWDVQTHYGARPWSAELPSAGRPLDFAMLQALAARGVEVAALTHACGLSATGDAELDRELPLPERYDIPAATAAAVQGGRRVIACGTSVVRALEGCVAAHGRLVAGEGETDLVINAHHELKVVQGLFTGLHDPMASHYQLLQAFAELPLLDAAYRHAEAAGYLGHEFGDVCLITRKPERALP
jgi:S-adenosylmethionine:tRNA ribosyltransferase-isomerase